MKLGIGQKRLWVFDFDGSVSRRAADPNDVRLHSRCEAMLRFLARGPWNRVAVISTRRLEDLAAKIPVPKILLGGCSGLEWVLPGGLRTTPDETQERILGERRQAIAPFLREIAAIPGMEIADKKWSVAIHYRDASPRSFPRRMRLLQRLRNRGDIKIHRVHDAVEIQLVPGGSKSAGVRRLCRMIGWDPSLGGIAYAGGDEIDASVMKWVLRIGGSVYVVGDRITVPTARHVEGPGELASEVYADARNTGRNRPSSVGREASG